MIALDSQQMGQYLGIPSEEDWEQMKLNEQRRQLLERQHCVCDLCLNNKTVHNISLSLLHPSMTFEVDRVLNVKNELVSFT